MFKYKVIALTMLIAAFLSGEAYCQQATYDQELKTVSGKVINVDAEGSYLQIQTDSGKMEFYIGGVASLYRSTTHMASIEIEKGDFVKIQYIVNSSGRNNIIKLVDSQLGKF